MWWQGEASVPAHFAPLRASWAEQHPSWEIRLWDEAAATKLINESYPWFAPTFHALPSKIQKADVSRYAILHAAGGVYADLDVEAFRPLDQLLAPVAAVGEKHGAARPVLHLFEEPVPHWDAHDTVVSNGLIAAPAGHPMLLRLLKAIRPIAEVFASGGSHKLQLALQQCHEEEQRELEEQISLPDDGGASGRRSCGCYRTHSSEIIFPLHEAMRAPFSFARPGEHADAVRVFIDELADGRWPPRPSAILTAQYWTTSWIDPEIGRLWLGGIADARKGDKEAAEKPMLAALWSKWGHRYKYLGVVPDVEKAAHAYLRALHWQPTYAHAYYELGNIRLEEHHALVRRAYPRAQPHARPTATPPPPSIPPNVPAPRNFHRDHFPPPSSAAHPPLPLPAPPLPAPPQTQDNAQKAKEEDATASPVKATKGSLAGADANAKLAEAERFLTHAVALRPDSLLSYNNLGVAQLQRGKLVEAEESFTRVLALHKNSFATVKGLDPQGGAHLNLGQALMRSGRTEEAHAHWLEALHTGVYESSRQAMVRLAQSNGRAKLPPAAEIDLIFGEALAKHGRAREAALSYAAAYSGAATQADEAGGGVLAVRERERIRKRVREGMRLLAAIWDEEEGALAVGGAGGGGSGGSGARARSQGRTPERGGGGGGGGSGSGGSAAGGGGRRVVMTEAGADGKTKVQELTTEQVRAMNEAAKQAHAKAQEVEEEQGDGGD